MSCNCPNCGTELKITMADSFNIAKISSPVKAKKVPKFTDSNMGKLRKCLYDCGMNHEVTIFNDCGVLRQDGTQRRRLKIWNAGGMSPKQSEQLGLACERAFGEDLIKAGVVSLPRPGRSPSKAFCVYLWVK